MKFTPVQLCTSPISALGQNDMMNENNIEINNIADKKVIIQY